jgi:hypothetical protein
MHRLGDIGDPPALAIRSDMMTTADRSRKATRPRLHNLILGGIVQ